MLRWAAQSHVCKTRGAKLGQVLVLGVCGVRLLSNKMLELTSRVYLYLLVPCARCICTSSVPCCCCTAKATGPLRCSRAVCCRAARAWAADTMRVWAVAAVCGALVTAHLLRLRAHAAPSHRFCQHVLVALTPPRWHASVELHPVLRLEFYPAHSCCCVMLPAMPAIAHGSRPWKLARVL